jgi:hypothetical protein
VILRSEFPLKIEDMHAMTAPHSIDPARFLAEQLTDPASDLLRAMTTAFVNALMSAEADAICGAEYGAASPQRVTSRDGYRRRELDTRTGTLEVAIPKLRSGSYFPDWLLERRRPRRGGPDERGGDLLPAWGLHTADGEAGREPGDHLPVEVPGQQDGR